MSEQVTIRQAIPTDLDALRELAIRTFCDTFADSADPADMADYVRDVLSVERLGGELSAAENIFLLLFLPGETLPAGYMKLRIGTAEKEIVGERPIELERLYVDRSAIGQGMGSRLMQTAIDEAVLLGYDTLWLGVWEQNYRAIAFYKRWGFEQVGSHVFVLGSDHQTDLVMQRAL